MQIQSLAGLAQAHKTLYAWPGGYQLNLILADGTVLCRSCFKQNYQLIAEDFKDNCNTGWLPLGLEVNWEDPDLRCEHCNTPMPGEYCDEQAEETCK